MKTSGQNVSGSKGQFLQQLNKKTNGYSQRLPCVKGAVNEVD